jgi:hypothetical protein
VTIVEFSEASAEIVWNPRHEPHTANGSPALFDATALSNRYFAVSK